MQRGSYFFVIDAFIAGIIIAGTLVLIYGNAVQTSDERQVFYAAEDFLHVLESTAIQDYDSELIRTYITSGIITDTKLTILEQIGQLHLNWTRKIADYNGQDPSYSIHVGNLTHDLEKDVPENVGIRLLIDGTAYKVQDGAVQMDEAGVFFVSKRILLLRETPADIYEPIIVEVQSWQ